MSLVQSQPESRTKLSHLVVLAATAVVLFALPAQSQQNTFPAAGNVGLGTNAPTELLEVSTVGTLGHLQMKLNAATDRFAQQTYYENGVLKWNIYNDFANDNLTYGNGSGPKMAITPTGNFGIGTITPTSKLHVVGDAFITGNITVSGNIAAKYQDVAEWVPATVKMEPGTVVVLNPEKVNEVMPATVAYDTTVAGVVSAMPGLILGEAGDAKAQVATTGRVKVNASAVGAPIRIGDLLVTGEKSGFAIKSEPMKIGGRAIHQPGTIIGKALEPLAAGEGQILVLLSLQ